MVVLMMLVFCTQVMAQTPLEYGTTTPGSLNPQAPISLYTFSGTEGDQITVQAISLDPSLDLDLTIQRGIETMAVGSTDPFTPNSNDARIDYRIPVTGTYVILVASPDEGTGDFAIKLSQQILDDVTLLNDEPTSLTIMENGVRYVQYDSTIAEATGLRLSGDAPFYATIYNRTGTIVSHIRTRSALIHLDEHDVYQVALRSVDPSIPVNVSLVIATTDSTPSSRPSSSLTPTPLTIITPVRTPVVESDIICEVFSDGFPNVRIAPNTFDSIITQIQPGTMYRAVGIYDEWFQVLVPTSPFESGWVRSDVVGINGYCEEIPSVSPFNTPVIPSHTPTTTPTATNTPEISPTPTATHTPTVTPTITNTPLPTDTPTVTPTVSVQIAPEDSEFNNPLNVPLGNTLSVLDFVSYPEGDTQDKVEWDVSGMDEDTTTANGVARLVITATCFGNGTENVEFMIDNQTYGCGDTLVDQDVTFTTKTGMVTITAVAGTETNVQWVLTGTATRK